MNEIDKIIETNEINEYDLDEESLSNNSEEYYSEDDSENDTITESINDEPIKKKRGRKCKVKEEIVEKIQKKRGRKPKIKDENKVEKIPKKRGRKPKEKVYSVKEIPKTFFEENKNETLILHLPIKTSDKIDLNDPLPDIKKNNNYQINEEKNFSLYENNSDIYNNNLLTQVNLIESNYTSNLFDYDENDENDNLFNYNITDINQPLNQPLYDIEENKNNRINKKNLKNIMYEFINANNDKTWPEKTNIYCWWCCHPFIWMPCALPEYYKKDKFYVNGCFCSFNCASSYNFSKNNDNIWERYSLLNLMYKKIYNNPKLIKINLAPPRETLKIFGGYLTIEEFRENMIKNDKSFTVINPPLISIIPKIEENMINKLTKNSYPLINETILNKTQNSLKLKRNKPLTNLNSTLQSFMDLKIV